MILEACVDSLETALEAEKAGANRIELCIDLANDGLSPPIEMIKLMLKKLHIPIKVMVRLRAGDFVYSDKEIESMIRYGEECSKVGVKAIVTGMLTEDKTINVEQLERLALSLPEMDITFHKAIDLVEDPIEELLKCVHINNLTSVLTSGKEKTAFDGIPYLKKMISALQPRIKIIIAGKVTKMNIDDLHLALNASEYHGKKVVN